MSCPRVLVICDAAEVCQTLKSTLKRGGFEPVIVTSGEEGMRAAARGGIATALVDLGLAGNSSLQTIRALREVASPAEIIVMSGPGAPDTALESLHEQIFDCLDRPFEAGALLRSVRRAVERRDLIIENKQLVSKLERERNGQIRKMKSASKGSDSFDVHLVGESESMQRVRQSIAEVADSDMTVLLRGESGTGKDIVAWLLHEASGRGDRENFVKINCPAVPEPLLESELFGHEPGAFTGADRRKPGRFELAVGGTIFLDEICEIPLMIQAKLLQVIEHKQFTRLGGGATIRTDARIIAATNAPVERMISEGEFRSDLFYRLNQYTIFLPPLRERREDIPGLIQHFMGRYGSLYNRMGLVVSSETLSRLIDHDWPGNVREMEAAIRRFCLTGREDSLIAEIEQPSRTLDPASVQSKELKETEIRTVLAALTEAQWNRRQAAQLLGISYSSLRRRIGKYNLKTRWLGEHCSSSKHATL